MRKSFLLILLSMIIMCSLFAKTEKVIALGFDKKDRESQYIFDMLLRRDLDMSFKTNTKIELVPVKESIKALKNEGFKGDLESLEIPTAEKIATQFGATLAFWGSVNKGADNTFGIEVKVLSLRTKEMKSFFFVVSKNKDERFATLEKELVQKIANFATEEIAKLFTIAEQDLNTKKYDSAENGFLKLLEIDDQNIEIYYNLGLVYYGKNNLNKAVEFFNKTLTFNPDRENALLYLSDTYKKQGNLDKSIETLEKVANVKNDDNQWLIIAVLYKEKNNYEKTLMALDNVLKINNTNEDAHILYAMVTYDNKDYTKAIPHLEFVTNIHPDDDEMARKLAISYQRTGQLEKAIENYTSIIAKDATNSKAYLNLGAAYRALSFEKDANKYNQLALETYIKVQTLLPENGKVDVSLADIYLNMNNLTKSETYANSAIKKSSDIHEPYIILGMIYQKKGIAKHSEYIDLQKKTDSGSLYGAQLDQTIKNRDAAKAVANTLFKKTDEYYKTAKTKTSNQSILSDIDSRIQTNNQYINMTKKDFFN